MAIVVTFPRLLFSLISMGCVSILAVPAHEAAQRPARPNPHTGSVFRTSHDCMACHNGLTTPTGEDVSIGSSWRASMMANSSRDPYWQASVRRETIDHPSRKEDIEDECSICHMPMSRADASAAGRRGKVFAHLPIKRGRSLDDALAADGVSCTLCHQIQRDTLGTRASFTGGFVVDRAVPTKRPIFGPFDVEPGRATIMHSASGFKPAEAVHVRQSELCATCHTLYTHARGARGEVVGELPEQMPYLEWRQSAFREKRGCQSCHMPAVEDATRIASVLGEPRTGLARHVFRGGNFFMQRLLNRYRAELGVEAPSNELDAAARDTVRFLQSETAEVEVDRARAAGGRLDFDVTVRSLAGHKLPTGYPSRRVWLHVLVRDNAGRLLFESGALLGNGAIVGNDADADAATYEPHYTEIRRSDEVQIYESVMADAGGRVTTGLLTGLRFVKDNRLLPDGFDKSTVESDIAVQGHAAQDADFGGGGDRVRYSIEIAEAEGPFSIDVELWYQPIAFRWAQNLRGYRAKETERFVSYFESMSSGSSEILVRRRAMAH
jgi:hypothetical protein